MRKFIDVGTGQVELARGNVILRSVAIGSCVVVVAYDSVRRVGALAHVMLPGKAPCSKTAERTRYTADAIDELISQMTEADSHLGNIETALVGGGNVLKKQDDTVCRDNIESTISLLDQKNIPIRAAVLGGIQRKGVYLDVQSGCISYTQGEDREKILWDTEKEEVSI